MSILFIILAAIFKAIADTLVHHFDTSVFKYKDRRFWDASISWQYAHYLRFTKYKIDGWHLANSGMIVCFCLAFVFHHPFLKWWIELLITGVLFNVVFNLFYNKILRA